MYYDYKRCRTVNEMICVVKHALGGDSTVEIEKKRNKLVMSELLAKLKHARK